MKATWLPFFSTSLPLITYLPSSRPAPFAIIKSISSAPGLSFTKLLNKMNYKTFEKEKDLYFKYLPSKKVFKKKNVNKEIKDNPFQVLKQLNLD